MHADDTHRRHALTIALANFPLTDWLDFHGAIDEGRYEQLLLCPVCLADKVSVRVDTGRWRCFRCERYTPQHVPITGAGGVFSLVRWIEQLSTKDTIMRIIELGTPPIGDPDSLPDILLKADVDEVIDQARSPAGLPQGCIPLASMPEPPAYVLRRGITRDDAIAWGLQYVPPGRGWVSNRLVFPVWGADGACLYWQARACWDAHEHVPRDDKDKFRKTLNPSQEFCVWHGKFPKGATRCPVCMSPVQFGSHDVLLNIGQACRYPRVGICEGPTSAIRGGPSCVATFGKQLSPQQIAILVRHGVKAIDFMWDGPTEKEPAGAIAAMMVAASNVAAVIEDVRIVLYPRGDPGDYSRPDNDYFRHHALPYHLTTGLL